MTDTTQPEVTELTEVTETTDSTDSVDSVESTESTEVTDETLSDGEAPKPAKVGAAGPRPSGRLAQLEQEGDVAADYLEGLLDIADLDGDIDMDVEGDRAMVSIVGEDLDLLVGKGGTVLDALQELTRLAITRETGDRSRMMLDIGGFRAARRDELTEIGTKAAKDAKAANEPVKLKPMTPFERKVVHDAVAAEGCASESEGEEPRRFVVVLPPASD